MGTKVIKPVSIKLPDNPEIGDFSKLGISTSEHGKVLEEINIEKGYFKAVLDVSESDEIYIYLTEAEEES